ncbi:hypothetical protein PGT21_008817 [Puccinia graminis f. sp. tritici]|uniref:trimethyllysine dioxygenase n=1 Tax=Puccinia graminis f. sp. tritici TaxID=56615 RepID=A0A5B0N5K6_PUCGR|nr:hypothetical protein PGTUg99_033725 [Puccinia graminis f. sp. tritici]KAA1094070.1 hypothetical protein PGT21_008817 [Puccinia graminis f. sp. tritici]
MVQSLLSLSQSIVRSGVAKRKPTVGRPQPSRRQASLIPAVRRARHYCRSTSPPLIVNLCRSSGYPDNPKAPGPGQQSGSIRAFSLTSASTIRLPQEPSAAHSAIPESISKSIGYQLDHLGLLVQFDKDRSSKFDHIWLRDNCRCEKCFHAHTKQRLLDTYEIPLDIQPTRVDLEGEGFSLTWPDGHKSLIQLSFLLQHAYDPPLAPSSASSSTQTPSSEKYLWDKAIANRLPSVSFNDLFSQDQATWKGDLYVLEWLRKIEKYGFCLVDDVPPTPEATADLLKRIAFIRETHYGTLWDFTADLQHGDTAYTDLALGAHTDTTYFSDPIGLQLFHLLSPPSSHEGGKSLLVDGFAAAAKLKLECREAYELMSEEPIETHASGGVDVAFRPLLPQPVFSHHPHTGELTIIRWNPDDRLPLNPRSAGRVKQLYLAFREWQKIIKSEQMELWTQMKMGQALIFDNHRVLHGRSSFKGSRRLCGGYVNGDDYRSRLRSLEQRLLSRSPGATNHQA